MPQYHAQFPYKALGDGELTLAEGERVQVIAQQDEHGDDMWWQVQKADGSSGVVPASYLVMDGGASFEVLHPGREAVTPPEPTETAKSPEPTETAKSPEPTAAELKEEAEDAVAPLPGPPPRPSAPPPRPSQPPTPMGSSSMIAVHPPPGIERSYSNFSSDSDSVDTGYQLSKPSSAQLQRTASTMSNMSTDSSGMIFNMESVQATDARFSTGEEFISVTLAEPRKEGLVHKTLSWNLIVQTNLPGFQQQAFQIRRKFTDFLWIQEFLTWDLFDVIVPPLPAENSTVKMTSVDEYFVRKRTQAVQLFMGRCVRHVKIRDHPLFRAFLEMSSPVLKDIKKKNLAVKFKCSKSTDKLYRPIAQEKLLRAQDFLTALTRQLKTFCEKTGQHVKVHKHVENADNKAGYYDTWRAISNVEGENTYLGIRLRKLAETIQTTEREVTSKRTENEQEFRMYIKSLYAYSKTAGEYLQKVQDLDETVAHWNHELLVARDTLKVKKDHREVAASNAVVPETKPIEFKEGEDMHKTLKAQKKLEEFEFNAYKKAQSDHKKLHGEVEMLEKKIITCEANLAAATTKRDRIKAAYWDEIQYFDYLKDCELQLVHLIWLDRALETNEKTRQALLTAREMFSDPVDRNSRSIV